jgi:thiol-disulfide isomerase/thioredoxin
MRPFYGARAPGTPRGGFTAGVIHGGRLAGVTLAVRLVRGALPVLLALATCCAKPRPAAAPAPVPVTADRIKEMTNDPSAQLVLVNVWATWCGPCREEMPALVRLRHEGPPGVTIIMVSADFDVPTDKLVEFLTTNGVDFPTYLKTEKDTDFIAGLEPDWSGAIPATFLYSKGKLIDFWEGKATYETFVRKVREALGEARAAN